MKTNAVSRDLSCDDNSAERPRYFPRQMITADDLTLEADYFRNKLRRHNRLMHGWGVACGALVCPVAKTDGTDGTEPWKVKVKPGYILGPYGDEILIDCERTVDLRTSGVTGITGEPCTEAPDPWCSEVFLVQQQTTPLTMYVAVKYKEVMTRPVRVQPVGCGCDDTQCEYSRLRDGYEIGILKACPDSGQVAPNKDDLFKCPLPECPDCPSDPWVVLAAVTLNQEGSIQPIDNRSCRRLVAALGHFWWKCEGDKSQITSVEPGAT